MRLRVCVALALTAASLAGRPLIDPDTPVSAQNTSSLDPAGNPGTFSLIFSDEFNQDGRNFAEGNEPYWTALDMWSIPTNDWEYYSPQQVTTRAGNLVLTAEKTQTNPCCPFTSGMLVGWNQFCFTGGIVEIRAQLPGTGRHRGFWPAAWMVGNLGRVGYMNTTAAVWPWTYDNCDSNKQWQRINACDNEPGFGLNPLQGRGAPEIDIIEARIGGAPKHPYQRNLSQPTLINTYHFSPKNPANVSYVGGFQINNGTQEINVNGDDSHDYLGCITPIDDSYFTQMHTFRLEWYPKQKLMWYADDTFLFSFLQSTLGNYSNNEWSVKTRWISDEPSYLLLNLALSPIWGRPDDNLEWPGEFKIDYVRVYQREKRMGCDPPDYPTAEYIKAHPEWYNVKPPGPAPIPPQPSPPLPPPPPPPTPPGPPTPGCKPCGSGSKACCNPHTVPKQKCPGDIDCCECGQDACECPATPVGLV